MQLKTGFKNLVIAYCFTFVLFALLSLMMISACEIYWAHDFSIEITRTYLILYCSYLFLIPAIILTISKKSGIKISTKLFIIHFLVSLASISLLILAINKPCEDINNGRYMFIDAFGRILGYYLFKLSSFIILSIIIIKTIISLVKMKRNRNKQIS
jgi:hypothetical protein